MARCKVVVLRRRREKSANLCVTVAGAGHGLGAAAHSGELPEPQAGSLRQRSAAHEGVPLQSMLHEAQSGDGHGHAAPHAAGLCHTGPKHRMLQASMTSGLIALQLLAQAADALSLGDDVTRQVRGSCLDSNTTETLLPRFVMLFIYPCKGHART